MTHKSLIVLTLALASSLTAFAKTDPEEYHVQVVLTNGDTITGYIRNDLKTSLKNMFSKTGSIRQYINVGKEPKGGETKRYNSSEIKEYRFVEKTEGYPDGAVCVSEMISSPVPFKPLHSVRGLAWELDRRDSGSILRWDVYESSGGRNSVSYLVPAIGVKFKGAPAAFIIKANGKFNDWYLSYWLKKNYPELKDAWEEYYHKGEDAKAHRQELVDNPSTALLFYEDFLRDNPPIEEKVKDKKNKDK